MSRTVFGPAGVYVHVPFCLRKCLYCDFNSYRLNSTAAQRYVAAVCREMEHLLLESAVANTEFSSVFIGGGTPTVLPASDLSKIISVARRFLRGEAEITVEANPGTVSLQSLAAMLAAGVNRLSLGVQSFDNQLLQALGRIHNRDQALQSVENARRAGFDNINLDLMFAIPGQGMKAWQATVEQAIKLDVEHISCYSLIVEEGTPYAAMRDAGKLLLPGEELELEMYQWVIDRLFRAGYEHYEISNFARPGMACRHNLTYWHNRPYFGVGPGAHSFWEGQRTANVSDPAEYALQIDRQDKAIAECNVLDPDDEMDDTMMLGLRLLDGIQESRFKRRFGHSFSELYGKQMQKLIKQGLLTYQNGQLRLTAEGLPVANLVFAEFLR